LRVEQVADVADGAPERVNGSNFGLAQMCFDLCEGLLDCFVMTPLKGFFLLKLNPVA
jgi:hypothetical protein